MCLVSRRGFLGRSRACMKRNHAWYDLRAGNQYAGFGPSFFFLPAPAAPPPPRFRRSSNAILAPFARYQERQMDESITLTAAQRSITGKKVRALRAAGTVPIHMYGLKKESLTLQAELANLQTALRAAGFTPAETSP